MGIYNRKSINKLLRKIVNRNINFVRVGLGYLENENSFCLIEKIPISEKDSKNLDLDEVPEEELLEYELLLEEDDDVGLL